MLAACLMTLGSRIAPVSIGLGKANQLASSKTLAKPNLRADCAVAFEQAWGRVEDAIGGGERPQVKPSLALESRSLGVQAELTSAHSRVTTRHRPHHYRESIRRRRRAARRPRWCKPESRSIHIYENAARGSNLPRRPRPRGVRNERARRRAPPVRGRGARADRDPTRRVAAPPPAGRHRHDEETPSPQ